jgi:SET domain-containing protein 6
VSYPPFSSRQRHPDLFPPSSPCFTLDAFHLQGSRILSRSFTISAARAAGIEAGADEDDEEIAVMIPMADMLNAAYERDNARLFDDQEEGMESIRGDLPTSSGYTMMSTVQINKGDQIVRAQRVAANLVQHVFFPSQF